MTAGQIAADVGVVQGVAGEILTTIEGVDPAVALPAEAAQAILTMVGNLITAALTAWQTASGQPITTETITALLPNPTPLPEPPDA